LENYYGEQIEKFNPTVLFTSYSILEIGCTFKWYWHEFSHFNQFHKSGNIFKRAVLRNLQRRKILPFAWCSRHHLH